AVTAGAAIRCRGADIAANPRRFGGGNRWAPSSGGSAEARDHEAQGCEGANGSNHRSAKGSRAGIPRSGPIHVLVLGPGCAERRNRKPTGAGGHRAASPTANPPSCIAENGAVREPRPISSEAPQ